MVGQRSRLLLVLSLLIGAAACERAREVPRSETLVVDTSAPAESAVVVEPPVRAWDDGAGRALVVATDASDRALVVFPELTDSTLTDSTAFDLSPFRGAKVDLFARSGRVGTATLTGPGPAPAEDCASWPSMRVRAGKGPPSPWTVGFPGGQVAPIPLDSIEGLPSADSARLAAEVTRLAAALPGDTSGAFRGIPFSVRSVRRFQAAPGVDAFVAEIVRKVALEANPREEHLFVIAERDSGQATGRYAPAYSERTSGPEESVQSTDVLAALTIGQSPTTRLIARRDDGNGGSYAMFERLTPRRWRVRWTSAYAGC
jgi:hypothetical protein